jgi:hypothetical protein
MQSDTGRARMRVFLGIHEIAGYYAHLERGLRKLGVDADFFQLSYHPFYSGRLSNRFIRFAREVNRRTAPARGSRPVAALALASVSGLLRLLLFVWSLPRYDVFVFGYGSSFLPGFVDLPILRLFRRRVVFTFHGSDVRPPYMDGSDMAPSRGLTTTDCVRVAARKKRMVRRIERWADVLICHPPYAHFHERPFITSLTIGNPVQPQLAPDDSRERAGAVRILHSPSFPEAKGTVHIRRAVASLEARGFDIEYVEVSGVSNTRVLEELQKCDIVVDQLYSDAPLATFATEAAFLGRPAVIGGYITSQDLGVPPERIPPCELCHPAELEETIGRLVTDAAYRSECALRTRTWVAENWSPEKVAERMLHVVRGTAPADWWFDPADIGYLHGCCISEERIAALVQDILATAGPGALQLDDKPQLRERLMTWANAPAEDRCSPVS